MQCKITLESHKKLCNNNCVPFLMYYIDDNAFSGTDISDLFANYFEFVYMDVDNNNSNDLNIYTNTTSNSINLAFGTLSEVHICNKLCNINVNKGYGSNRINPLLFSNL